MNLWNEKKLLSECRFESTKRGGKGGQRKNKVETAVVATHLPTGLRAEASERREQIQNKQVAFFRLKLKIALEVRDKLQSVSDGLRARCKAQKIQISETHAEFPAVLKELLDLLCESEWEPKPVSEFLGVTSTQVLKTLKKYPKAFSQFNEQREKVGKRAFV